MLRTKKSKKKMVRTKRSESLHLVRTNLPKVWAVQGLTSNLYFVDLEHYKWGSPILLIKPEAMKLKVLLERKYYGEFKLTKHDS